MRQWVDIDAFESTPKCILTKSQSDCTGTYLTIRLHASSRFLLREGFPVLFLLPSGRGSDITLLDRTGQSDSALKIARLLTKN